MPFPCQWLGRNAKIGGLKFAPKGLCVGLSGQNKCISKYPGNTLSGHHPSVRGPSACS